MRTLLALFLSVISFSVYSITVDDLIAHYGKKEIMRAIANKLPEGFSVSGGSGYSHSPDQAYVNPITLKYDFERVGLTPDDVQKLIEAGRKREQEEKVLRSRIEAEEQKKRRIEEAKKILEEHRKEYLARDRESQSQSANEIETKQSHSNINSTSSLPKSYTTPSYKENNTHYPSSSDIDSAEFTEAIVKEGAILLQDLKPGSIRSSIPREDRMTFDVMREEGYTAEEAARNASEIRKKCEIINGLPCSYSRDW